MDAETWAVQQASGTWSELFDRTSLINSSQVLTVIFWLAAFWLLGVIFMPMTAVVFKPLKDKGYGVARLFGLIVWGYFVWLCASLGLPYNRGTILGVLGALALVNLVIAFIKKDRIKPLLKEIRGDIRTAEIVFLVCFFVFLFVRWMNPDLWHPYKGGEKPMDFSYFMAILKSESFPPYDPWFAGDTLNYYYYGMYLAGLMVKLLGIIPTVAYNLILPLWYAFLGSAAFAVGKTLYLKAWKPAAEDSRKADRAGIFTVVGMQVLGNLGTVVQIKNELIELGASGTGFSGVKAFFNGLGKLMSGQSLIMYKGDWYWVPSRAIPDTSITEFPIFTFLYADPHAHLFALPITVLVLVWLTAMIARFTDGGRHSVGEWVLSFAAAPLLIGTLFPTNTWDWPTYLCVTAAVLIYLIIRYFVLNAAPEKRRQRVIFMIALLVLVAAASLALFLPYIKNNTNQQAIEYFDETHTPISSFLMHWGVFLFFITAWYIVEVYRWMKYTPLRVCREGMNKHRNLLTAGAAVYALILFVMSYLGARIIWITLPLMTLSLLLLLRPEISDTERFVYFLVGVAFFAANLVEVIHLKYDNGRMNMVFKFYNQIWIMLSICAAFAFAGILKRDEEEHFAGAAVPVFKTCAALLVCGAFMYPVFAGTDKMTDRMSDSAPHTLDGMKYMETSIYYQDDFVMDLSEDYDAIQWMQDNVEGSPVIVEASPTEYKFGSRYTIYTGLPGVVGWNYHQRQQRPGRSNEVWDRVNGIGEFYNTTDLATAVRFIEKYNVKYIIVGQMEEGMYSADGIAKFAEADGVPAIVADENGVETEYSSLWECVYDRGNTRIYEVTMDGIGDEQ